MHPQSVIPLRNVSHFLFILFFSMHSKRAYFLNIFLIIFVVSQYCTLPIYNSISRYTLRLFGGITRMVRLSESSQTELYFMLNKLIYFCFHNALVGLAIRRWESGEESTPKGERIYVKRPIQQSVKSKAAKLCFMNVNSCFYLNRRLRHLSA